MKADRQGRDIPVPHLFVYLPTGVIYVRARFGSEGLPRLMKTTGETEIPKAQKAAALIIQQHRNEHLGIDDSPVFGKKKTRSGITFAKVAAMVLEEHTPSVRAKTQKSHMRYIPALIERFGAKPIQDISPLEFKRWIDTLRDKKFSSGRKPGERGYYAPRTRISFEGFSKHMNLVFRWAYENGKVKHLIVFANPDKEIITKRKGRRYSDDELKALWAQMNDDLRDQFVLASECYMRLNEALKLEWSRVDIQNGLVTLEAKHVKTGSKTGKGRVFYLSEFALERVRARHVDRDPASPWVFPSRDNPMKPRGANRTAWTGAKARAGITGKATWHHLRHTALSRALLESGQNAVKVSEYAGVHMVTIQKVYLHSNPEETKVVASGASLPLSVESRTTPKPGESRVNGGRFRRKGA